MKRFEKNAMRTKLIREILNAKVRFFAIAFVVMIGVTIFIASSMSYRNLKTSYEHTYDKLNFADFRVKAERIPPYIVEKVRKVVGVTLVTPRIRKDVSIILPNGNHIVGRTTGVTIQEPMVDAMLIKEGRSFKKGESMVCIAERHFAQFYNLHPGDSLTYYRQGRSYPIKIVGIASNPEYLVLAGDKGDFSPMMSVSTMAVIWMPTEDVQRMADMPGMFNQVLFKVKNPNNLSTQMTRVEEIMKYTGITEVTTQSEHLGNKMLVQDLEGFRHFALFFPILFLGIACFSIYILLSRLVYTQRPFIGVMRAMGYSKRQILLHYLSFAMIIGVLGAVAGAIVGYALSYAITAVYAGTIGIPLIKIKTYWLVLFQGMSLSLLFCAVAGILPALGSARLDPSKAMRGEMLEQKFHQPILEKVFPPLSRIPLFLKVPMRNMFRNKRRTVFTILGLVFSVMLVLVFLATLDTTKYAMNQGFSKNNRFDMVAVFLGGRDAALVDKIRRIEGVENVEPTIGYNCKLRWTGGSTDTVMMGIDPATEMRRFYTPQGKEIYIQDNHVLLSQWFHKKKGLQVGQTVEISTAWQTKKAIVSDFIDEPMGNQIYMPRDEVRQLLAYGTASRGSFYVKTSPASRLQVRSGLEKLPGLAAIIDLKEIKREIEHYIKLMYIIVYVMLIFALIMAFTLTFNTVTINILEREREVATMRTIGTESWKISAITTMENLILGLVSIIPGFLLGIAVGKYAMSLQQTEYFSLNLVVYPGTYALVAGGIIAILLICQVPSLRYVKRVELAVATKERGG